MDTIFYGELKNAVAAIGEFDEVNATEVVAEKRQALITALAGIVELSNIARKEVLLRLEYVLEDMAEEARDRVPLQSYLQQMIELVTDGTEPELIQEICMLQFAVRQLAGYDALIYFVYLKGMLCIQAGENPLTVQRHLRVILPEAVEAVYEENKPKNIFVPAPKAAKEPENLVQKYSEPSAKQDSEDGQRIALGEQFELRILEILLKEMDGNSVKELLQDMDNALLAIAMKGMDGESCGKIFQNMTDRRAERIASDMHYMGPVRLKDVRDAARHIIEQIFSMESCGRISLKENGLARIFLQLLEENDNDIERMKQLRSRSSDLEKLFEAYREYCKQVRSMR